MRKSGTLICTLFMIMMSEMDSANAQQIVRQQNFSENPVYKRGSYTGESVTLGNDQVSLKMFKRIDGWGWGEIYDSSGKCMAVLEHLGEIMIRDQDIPMRVTAETYQKKSGQLEDSIIFDVRSVVVKDKLKGTSFEEWMSYPLSEPCLRGQVLIILTKNKPLFHLQYRLVSTGNFYIRYIRGPWLKVGEGTFGTKKDDSIFPGVDWTIEDEWSSGTDSFKDPWAMRSVPNPYQVSIPVMAVSYQGTGIGLSWDPNQVSARWFNFRNQNPQPVFATPNFIDRMNNNLMGLMIPDARTEHHENEVFASDPVEMRIGEQIHFDAEIWLSKGNSMAVITDWVKRHGLPDSKPKWSYAQTLEKIASAYNTRFWHEGEGFGIRQRAEDKYSSRAPVFLIRWVKENKNNPLAAGLEKKIHWCAIQQSAGPDNTRIKTASANPAQRGDALLKIQRGDGAFYFDPAGRHYGKDDFRVATSFIEPMGLQGDVVLDVCMLPAIELMEVFNETKDNKYRDAAKKALDYCLTMQRPEGGDYWETPLHAPNLLAAGHAAIANYEAYRIFGDAKYKEKAIYWIRSVLPFTNLWSPADVQNLYNTKPCFCSSDWYFANWVRDHVQWEVLSVFAQSATHGINWSSVDPDINWKTFQEGITNAGIRWMNDHRDDNWRPHNIPSTYAAYQRGDFDDCFPDTHNSITGNYGGMFIMPETIANNIYAIRDSEQQMPDIQTDKTKLK